MKNDPFQIGHDYLKTGGKLDDIKALPPQEQPKAMLGESKALQDPILAVDLWYPEFHRLHVQIAQENSDFDRIWLKQYRPDLYRAIKTKENEIDDLNAAPLSKVMALMREWRELILDAELERKAKRP